MEPSEILDKAAEMYKNKMNGKKQRGIGGRKKYQIRKPLIGDTPSGAVTLAISTMKDLSNEGAAHKLGMDPLTFRFIRKLIILKDNPALNEKEKEEVKKAIKSIDDTMELRGARALAFSIVNRHWAFRTKTGETQDQKKKLTKDHQALDNSLFRIREICEASNEIKVPPLEMKERLEAMNYIGNAIAALSALLTKVGGNNE